MARRTRDTKATEQLLDLTKKKAAILRDQIVNHGAALQAEYDGERAEEQKYTERLKELRAHNERVEAEAKKLGFSNNAAREEAEDKAAAEAQAKADAEAKAKADAEAKANAPQLRTDGPTLAEYVKAGYKPETYPPQGYAPANDPESIKQAEASAKRRADDDAKKGAEPQK
jgi:membrane protein involved in colicin uptake